MSGKKYFDPLDLNSCPVSHFPITKKKEWVDVVCGEKYSISVLLIGENIILIIPRGEADREGIEKGVSFVDDIISAKITHNKNFIRIEYCFHFNEISLEARDFFINYLKTTKSMQGIVFCGLSSIMKVSVRLAERISNFTFPIAITEDYESAVKQAMEMLNVGKETSEKKPEFLKKLSKSEWHIIREGYEAKCEIIDDNILYSEVAGNINELSIREYSGLTRKILEEIKDIEKGYYRIANWSGIKKSTWAARRLFVNELTKMNSKYPCKISLMYGIKGILRMLVDASAQMIPFKFIITRDFDESIDIILRLKSGEKFEGETVKLIKSAKKLTVNDQIKRYVDELLQNLAELNWDKSGLNIESRILESHPFSTVYQIIDLLKQDFDAVLSDQKRFEKDLQIEKAYLGHLFDNPHFAVALADQNGKIVNINQTFTNLFGFSLEEVIGFGLEEEIKPKNNIPAELEIDGVDYSKKPVVYGTRLSKDRRAIDVLVRFIPIIIEGRKVGTYGIYINMTRPKQIEKALRESEERYRLLIEHLGEGIGFIDREDRFIFANPATGIIFGIPSSVLVGRSLREFTDELESRKILDKTEAREKGSRITYDLEIIRPDGEHRNLLITGTPQYDENDKFSGNFVIFHDMTEHMRYQQALAISEARYRTIVENMQDIVYTYDRSGIITYISPSIENFGYFVEEVIGHHLLEFVHPDDHEQVIEAFWLLLKENWDSPVLFRIMTKSGDIRHVEENGKVVKDDNGRMIHTTGIIRDITERKKAEDELSKYRQHLEKLVEERTIDLEHINAKLRAEIIERKQALKALQKSEDRFRKLFENSNDAIIIYDIDGRIIDANLKTCEMLGCCKEDLLNHSFEKLFIEEEKPTAEWALKSISNSNTSDFESAFKTFNGMTINIEMSSSIINREEGIVQGIVRDITESKRSELLQSTLYRIAKEANSDISLTELFGSIHQSISSLIDATNFYIALYDRDKDLVALPYLVDEVDSNTGEDRPDLSIVKYVIKTGTPLLLNISRDRAILREMGIEVSSGNMPKMWLGVPLMSKLKIIGALVVHNYTDENAYSERDREMIMFVSDQVASAIELKNNEDRLRQSKEFAEKCNAAKSEFLANISHEIRTPLNAILGFCELILNDNAIKKIKNYTGLIITESEVLLDLINELLDLAKIDSGKLTLESLPFDLSRVIQSIRVSMIVKARNKGINLSFHIDENTPTRLEGDPTRLRQILVNLVGNAIKFTGEKGSVKIKINMLEESGNDVLLYFEVKDTGIGIPKEKQDVIFDSFIQADGSTTRKYGGTGLGTTIAKELVEMMNGKIGVKSEVGKGSTFWFTVKLKKRYVAEKDDIKDSRKPEMELKRKKPALPGSLGSILLVEDYAPNRDIAKAHLQSAGYKTEFAGNGIEAVKKCSEHHFDLILMDVQMPEMDGYEATRHIREGQTVNAHATILGMTANAYQSDIQKCLDSGMNDVIVKPIRKKTFLEVVERWVSKSGAPDQEHIIELAKDKDLHIVEENLPIRYEHAIREFEMDKEFLDDLLNEFLENCAEQLLIMEEAIAKNDSDTLRHEAHKIKGGAANLTAMPLANAAEILEIMGKSGDLTDGKKALDRIRNEYIQLKNYFLKISES